MAFFKRPPQLDYLTEFNETYTSLVNDGPTSSDAVEAWVGNPPSFTAKELAATWRKVELEEIEQADKLPNPSYFRVVQYKTNPTSYLDKSDDAKKVYLQLGEELFDSGALDAPYDENLPDDPDDKWGSSPGRVRLYALMYLSVYATELGHPRAEEWKSIARAGLDSTPRAEPTMGLAEWWSRIA